MEEALISDFGFEVIAREQFEAVYGCDPHSFLLRLVGLRPGRDNGACLEN